ncbi:MAG TPA: hypothetical protein VM140_03560 [Burkholderiales bacterium]|nr:hypothetical protein [Burkholderiales bacterium]
MKMRLAVLVVALVLASSARADVGLNIYGFSWHIDGDKARAEKADNWINPGLGVRYRVPGETFDYFFDAGAYRDSGRNTAVLAGGAVHWRATQSARLGLALVMLNSKTYNGGDTFVAPLPVAAWEFRSVTFNMVWMPKVRDINGINTLGFWLTYWPR